MAIILDFDDVCVDSTRLFCEYHNKIYNTNIVVEELTSFDFYKDLGITKNEFLQRFLNFYRTKEFLDAPEIKGAKEGISELSKTDELIVISYRDNSIEEFTRLQAEKLFPGMISKVICMGAYLQGENQERKEFIAKKLNARLAIDDGIHHVEGYARENIPALLLAQPWNRNCCKADEKCVGHIRVKDWKEIVEVAKTI